MVVQLSSNIYLDFTSSQKFVIRLNIAQSSDTSLVPFWFTVESRVSRIQLYVFIALYSVSLSKLDVRFLREEIGDGWTHAIN